MKARQTEAADAEARRLGESPSEPLEARDSNLGGGGGSVPATLLVQQLAARVSRWAGVPGVGEWNRIELQLEKAETFSSWRPLQTFSKIELYVFTTLSKFTGTVIIFIFIIVIGGCCIVIGFLVWGCVCCCSPRSRPFEPSATLAVATCEGDVVATGVAAPEAAIAGPADARK